MGWRRQALQQWKQILAKEWKSAVIKFYESRRKTFCIPGVEFFRKKKESIWNINCLYSLLRAKAKFNAR